MHLEVDDQDFYLDLLFCHLTLRYFVGIILKIRDFTLEAAGKMNFYRSAVDDRFRQSADQSSTGLLTCRTRNRIMAEYELRDMSKPIGISGDLIKLVDSLPAKSKDAASSVEALAAGLQREEERS